MSLIAALFVWLSTTCSYASVWDARQIAQSNSQSIRLIDERRNEVAILSVPQLRRILEIKERISGISRVDARLIITQGDSPNAGAAPEGGTNFIVINTAMLRFFGDDDDVMAFILGHEIGHLARGHLQAARTRDTILGVVGWFAGLALDFGIARRTGSSTNLGRILGGLTANLFSLKFDRDQEREADATGLTWMYEAGYNPIGATRFFQTIPTSSFDFFSNHPASSERMENMRVQIASFGPQPQAPTASLIAKSSTPVESSNQAATPKRGSVDDAVLAEFRENSSEPDDPIVLGLAAYKERRFADAFKFATLAANNSDPRGQLGLGLLYLGGFGTARDYNKAIENFKLAAAQNSAMAATYLGLIYENGLGVKKDFLVACAYYKTAADAGFPPGMGRLAECKMLASLGAPVIGVPSDPAGAISLAQKASAYNEPTANFVLAFAYSRGIGLEQNYQEARRRFEAASQMGLYEADNFLGQMYFFGQGVPQDNVEAVRLFQKAALKGSAGGKTNLGFSYLRGIGVSQDLAQAHQLFQEAFKSGQIVAAYGLGILYRDALGVPRDLSLALAYFDYSANKGYAEAVRFRDELAAKLSQTDLRRSKELSLDVAREAGI